MTALSAGSYGESQPDGTTRELFTVYDYPDQWRRGAQELFVLKRLWRTTPARSFIGPELPTGEPVPSMVWGQDPHVPAPAIDAM